MPSGSNAACRHSWLRAVLTTERPATSGEVAKDCQRRTCDLIGGMRHAMTSEKRGERNDAERMAGFNSPCHGKELKTWWAHRRAEVEERFVSLNIGM